MVFNKKITSKKILTFYKILGFLLLSAVLAACTSAGQFDAAKALSVGVGFLQAGLLDEDSVINTATLAAKEFDGKNNVASADNAYAIRLSKITQGLVNTDGLNLNFRVYLSKDVNAFAMADGTVRVYSGLLDAMPDDQVLAVIGHEIGHVKLRHSYKQMKEQLLTNAAFDAVKSVGGVVGDLTASQLGQIAHTAVSAKFSQKDELESDAFAVRILKRLGKDPYAMKRSIETLQKKHGSGGGFLSSHPSNDQRVAKIQEEIDRT